MIVFVFSETIPQILSCTSAFSTLLALLAKTVRRLAPFIVCLSRSHMSTTWFMACHFTTVYFFDLVHVLMFCSCIPSIIFFDFCLYYLATIVFRVRHVSICMFGCLVYIVFDNYFFLRCRTISTYLCDCTYLSHDLFHTLCGITHFIFQLEEWRHSHICTVLMSMLSFLHRPHVSGPIQWARGGVGLKPSAAARPEPRFCPAGTPSSHGRVQCWPIICPAVFSLVI